MDDTRFLVFVLGVVCVAALSVLAYVVMISAHPDDEAGPPRGRW